MKLFATVLVAADMKNIDVNEMVNTRIRKEASFLDNTMVTSLIYVAHIVV